MWPLGWPWWGGILQAETVKEPHRRLMLLFWGADDAFGHPFWQQMHGCFLSMDLLHDHIRLNVVLLWLSEEADYLDQWHPVSGKMPQHFKQALAQYHKIMCQLPWLTNLLWASGKQQLQQTSLHRSSWKPDPPLQFCRANSAWLWLSAGDRDTA